VLSDAKAIAETVQRVSPDTLVSICMTPCNSLHIAHAIIYQVVLDGVCSVASEEIRMDAWGIDVVLTATQKGLGTPPGLSVLVASQRAIQV
jgi:alanine-glyoxylate transaminase/serine-glyoxylate transaminase/serine-pyruvate transaminase